MARRLAAGGALSLVAVALLALSLAGSAQADTMVSSLPGLCTSLPKDRVKRSLLSSPGQRGQHKPRRTLPRRTLDVALCVLRCGMHWEPSYLH